jgi:hypothetical protein
MRFRNKIIMVSLTFILLMGLVQNAYAYLNPGTGSYFFQILIASLLAGLFLIKNLLRSLIPELKKSFFKTVNFIKNFINE